MVTENTPKLIELYRLGTRLFLAALFPIATAAAIFTEEIIALWTGNAAIASSMTILVPLYLIGTALNGAMQFPYALQLAYGISRLPLMINIILVSIMIPMTIFLAIQFGVIGGAASWAISGSLYLLIGTWLTHKILLKGLGLKWLLWDVGMPLLISITMVGITGSKIHEWGYAPHLQLFIGGGLVLSAFLIIILFSPHLRLAIQHNFFPGKKEV